MNALTVSRTPSSSSGYRVVCPGLPAPRELRCDDQRLHDPTNEFETPYRVINYHVSGDQLSRLQFLLE
jgi:hypothetical protein